MTDNDTRRMLGEDEMHEMAFVLSNYIPGKHAVCEAAVADLWNVSISSLLSAAREAGREEGRREQVGNTRMVDDMRMREIGDLTRERARLTRELDDLRALLRAGKPDAC